jgi:integrase
MSSKRGQNEGSIYRRADGRWAGAVSLGYKGGKRYRKAIYGKTRAEVRRKVAAAQRAAEQGLPLGSERQTLSQFLRDWLEHSVKPSTRPRTHASYAQLVRLHIEPELGRVPLAKLSPQQVQQLMNRKLASGLSPRTVRYIRAVLRRALNQALKWGLVPRNVATLVEAPKSEACEIRPLDPHQARRLLEALRGDRAEALYSVALAVGLRLGEALGLRWDAVDLDAGVLVVRSQLQRLEGKLRLTERKTSRARRTIHLPVAVVEALRRHRIRQFEERLLAGERWTETGLVFTSTIGTPCDARNVTRHLALVLDRAGLPHVRFHDLRHTCASLLLAQNVHPRVVMEILGHSQIALTMNTYSHVMPTMQEEAASRMDAVLSIPR